MRRWYLHTKAAMQMVFVLLRSKPPSLAWWTTGPLEKVRPYDPLPEKTKNGVEMMAARNEFESFQVVLRADSQDIEGLDVDASDLKGPGNSILGRNNVVVYLERYLDFAQPSSIAGKPGEWPDALVPRVDRYFGEKRSAFPFKVASHRN